MCIREMKGNGMTSTCRLNERRGKRDANTFEWETKRVSERERESESEKETKHKLEYEKPYTYEYSTLAKTKQPANVADR